MDVKSLDEWTLRGETGNFEEVKFTFVFILVNVKKKERKNSVFYENKFSKRDKYPYFSDEFGLHLVLGRVEEESYAYQCGVREGDIIVYVNGWLITVMDKPQAWRQNTKYTYKYK